MRKQTVQGVSSRLYPVDKIATKAAESRFQYNYNNAAKLDFQAIRLGNPRQQAFSPSETARTRTGMQYLVTNHSSALSSNECPYSKTRSVGRKVHYRQKMRMTS